MLVWDGTGRESLTQVQGTIENMTWESVNSLFSKHRTPWVRPVRGSPERIGLPLLCDRGCSPSGSFFLSSQWTHKGIPGFLKRKIKILCLLSGQWLTVISTNSKVGRNRNFHKRKQLHLQIGAKVGWSGHLSSFMRGWLTEKNSPVTGNAELIDGISKDLSKFFSLCFYDLHMSGNTPLEMIYCISTQICSLYFQSLSGGAAAFCSDHWPNSSKRAWTGPSLIFIQSKSIEGKLFLSYPPREGVSKGDTGQLYYPLQLLWWLLRSKVILIIQHSCSLLVTLCHYILFAKWNSIFSIWKSMTKVLRL